MPTSAPAPAPAARPRPAARLPVGAWARTLRGTFQAAFTNQLRFYTTSGWLLSSLLSPIFLLATAAVVAHFITGGGVPPKFFALTGYPDYLAFVVLGLAASALVNSALEDGGTAIYDEESAGTWDLLALTPMNKFVWMFGKTLAGMVNSLIDFVLILLAGVLAFGIALTPGNLAVALLGLGLTMVGLQGVSFLMAAVGLRWKQPYALAMIFSPALIFLSGMVFPTQALPPWLQTIAAGFPLTHGLHILREAVLLGRGLEGLGGSFALLLLTGAASMLLGYVAFRVMEERARRAGVLGTY